LPDIQHTISQLESEVPVYDSLVREVLTTGKGDMREVKEWSSASLEIVNKALYMLTTQNREANHQSGLQTLSYLKSRIIDIETRAMTMNPFSASQSQEFHGNSAEREREFNKVVVSGS
jgi:hypothetical protein